MNLSEFKAWFEGYTEEMGDAPTKAQWKKIKKRVSEISSDPTTWPIFVDRYVRRYPQPWWGGPQWSLTTVGASAPEQTTTNEAFAQLGRIEAQHTD